MEVNVYSLTEELILSKLLNTKESLILSTIEVINEQGLQGLTTREVAKKQGISESTIFKHYKSKNELILAVLDYFSKYDQSIIDSLGLKNLKPLEAITYFIEAYVTYYENYPEITAISLSFEGLNREAELSAVIYRIFTQRFNTIKSLIEEAIHQKEIPQDLVPESVADLIIGLEREVILRWRFENFNFPLKDQALSALKMLLDIIKIKNGTNAPVD